MALLAACADFGLNALSGCWEIKGNVFIEALFLTGGTAGLFTFLLGYFARNIRPQSHQRWIWLSLALPLCAFILIYFQAALPIELDPYCAKCRPGIDDAVIGVALYGVAGAISSLIAVIFIGVLKLLRRSPESKPLQ